MVWHGTDKAGSRWERSNLSPICVRGITTAKKNVEALLPAGGENEAIRAKYDSLKTKEDFAEMPQNHGYEFTIEE